MTVNTFSNDKNNSLDDPDEQCYTLCQVCAWGGFPKEKIFTVINRLRSENEEGFIYEIVEYDYDPTSKNKVLHSHRYDHKIINELINSLLHQDGIDE
jgi:hypothetical protein